MHSDQWCGGSTATHTARTRGELHALCDGRCLQYEITTRETQREREREMRVRLSVCHSAVREPVGARAAPATLRLGDSKMIQIPALQIQVLRLAYMCLAQPSDRVPCSVLFCS